MFLSIKKHLSSDFKKSVLTLVSGAAIAQLVSLLFYPVVTRLYSESEFGEFNVFVRWIAFFSTIVTLRFENVLPILPTKESAFKFYRFLVVFAIVFSAFIGVLGLLYFSIYKNDRLILLSWGFVSITFALIGIANLATNWSIREKKFKTITYSRITNAFSISGFRLLFAYFGWTKVGLLLATLLGSFLTLFPFTLDFFKTRKLISKSDESVQRIAKANYVFPLFNLPHALVELGTDVLVAASISHFYGYSFFGSFSLSYLLLRIPLNTIGQSIGQVFFQKMNEYVIENKSVKPLFIKTIKSLLLIGIIPFVVLTFLAPQLFAFFFGENWFFAGEIAAILSIQLLVNFVVSSVSYVSITFKKQFIVFIIGLFSAVFQLAVFYILPKYYIIGNSEDNFKMIVLIYSIGMIFITIFALGMYWNFIQKHEQSLQLRQ